MAAPEKQKYMLYNNIMFTVASHLVEVKTGKPFSAFLSERFFKPLEMTSTYLQYSSAVVSGQGERVASGHQFNETDDTWDVFDAFDAPEAQGAGSIITSAADYIKWVRAMASIRHPISADSSKALTRPRILIDPEDNDPDPFCSPPLYCLGWETYYYRGVQVVMHEGLIDGFGSSHFFSPAHNFGGVILGNADGAEQITWILARELIDAALNIPGSREA
jgi:CubicO group peptidase (beta-lactamase class C family)